MMPPIAAWLCTRASPPTFPSTTGEGGVRMTTVLPPKTDLGVEIDGNSLTIEDVVRVARRGGRAALSPDAVERIEAARRLKEEMIRREIPIYGVTTGFGDSAHRQIAPSKTAA